MSDLSRTTHETLAHLYTEFLHSYASSAAAHAYAAQMPLVREQAARNFRQIIEAADAGSDVTDAVLTGLLPHADTENNRERGAWIHMAPAIHGDVVQWHERLGWAEASEWPQKAQAILSFVRTCVEQPERLAEACHTFAELPYTTGFQSGTLTPILNALQPNAYVIVNGKTLQVINGWAGSRYNQGLLDYPAANAAGLELVEWVREQPGLPDLPPLRAVDRFDLFCHWLGTVKQVNFRQPRCWQIRPSGDGQWDAWRSGGFVAMGYDDFGDLSGLSRADFNTLRDELVAQHPGWTKRETNLLWTFARHVQEGDRVLVHDGKGEGLGLGTVSGFYYFVPDVTMGHCRPVVWDDLRRRHLGEVDWPRSFSEIEPAQLERAAHAPLAPERRTPQPQLSTEAVAPPPGTQSGTDQASAEPATVVAIHEARPIYQPSNAVRELLPAYPLTDCAAETGFDEAQLFDWVAAIERKGQAIFYGPPGTGKSYVASHLARHLAGGGDGFVEQIQFHAAYAYEDFVQGIRPVVATDNTLTYRLVPGRFLQFCQDAAGRSGRCVLVVDEINRADPARVFGEVMHLLEYRDQNVALAAGGHFRIPSNVRIIGTMNTADRSIALVDVALRRRFAFLALFPDYAVLRRYHAAHETGFDVGGLIDVLQRLNRQIGDVHYAVGITYFLRPDLVQTLAAIWRTEIEPYVEEYFYDRPEQVEPFRWEQVREEITTP